MRDMRMTALQNGGFCLMGNRQKSRQLRSELPPHCSGRELLQEGHSSMFSPFLNNLKNHTGTVSLNNCTDIHIYSQNIMCT